MLSNSMYTAIGHTAVKPLGSLIVAAKVRRDALLDTPGWLRLAEATSNQIRSTDTAAATAYLPPAVTVSNRVAHCGKRVKREGTRLNCMKAL